jgi:hypothetical protein
MPYGQGPYAGIIYAGIGTAPLSVTITPAMGLGMGGVPGPVAGITATRNTWALALAPGAYPMAGSVLPSLQAAMGLCVPSGASLEAGVAVPHLQAAWGLVVAPGGLLEPVMAIDQAAAVPFGLGLTTGPQVGVTFQAVPAQGLVLPSAVMPQVEIVLVTTSWNLVSWAIGLAQPGLPVYYPDLPPVPPLTSDEEFGAWFWQDGIEGTTPAAEPIDVSYSDPALVGALAQGDFIDLSYADSSLVATVQGNGLDLSFNDSSAGVTPEAEPVAIGFNDVTQGSTPEAEPLDLSFSDAHP